MIVGGHIEHLHRHVLESEQEFRAIRQQQIRVRSAELHHHIGCLEIVVGRLHVAVMQSVGTQVLPGLLRRFREEWPGVELVAEEAWQYSELAYGVESGRFDLSFAPLPLPDGPFAVRRVLDDPWVCLAPAGAPEVQAGTASLRQAGRLPLIGFTDPDLHDELVRRLRRTGSEPSFVFRGKFIRKQLLCENLGMPPANATIPGRSSTFSSSRIWEARMRSARPA